MAGQNGKKDHDARLVNGDEMTPEPIAIIGMAMRLPGGIRTASDFWKMLVEKRDTRCRVPADRYNIEAFYSKSGRVGTVKMQYGHFLAEADNLANMDTSFFTMIQTEVENLDPQQRMLLEVVYECLENGGQTSWRGSDIGMYVGVWGEDWLDMHAKDIQQSGRYNISGGHDFAISNRCSYEYDFRGPSMTIKTGCSSSIIALHEAVRATRAGDCRSAIVAGTNLIITPTMSIAMTEQGVLSAGGACKTFDAAADGYARGEAINAIHIKKLSDALRDNDPIRAVIRATASNCDGKTPGMSMPSSESHEAMIRRAYKEAQLDFFQTPFVECHGTGTAIGDPLEVGAIASVFGGQEQPVYIGSVKPNIGHSEGASGVSSIIKAALALENKTIPPNVHFATPNPKIPFVEANLKVPTEAVPWPKNRRERISVNSFGIGGANGHVILDSGGDFGVKEATGYAAPNGCAATNDHRMTNGYADTASLSHSMANGAGAGAASKNHLLVFSANNSSSLQRTLSEYQQYIQTHPSRLSDLAYTLSIRRSHFSHRAFCVTDGLETLEFSPLAKSKKTPELIFVFTGQGAQWAQMAKELIKDYPDFNADIEHLDDVLSKLAERPSWSIKEELLKDATKTQLAKAEFSQPLCTAVQVALVNLTRSWGIKPAAVVGHSSGEIAGAYAADAITAEEAIIVAYYRGQVTKSGTRNGGMAAVGMGREAVMAYLVDGVVIACENSGSSVTLSGDEDALCKVVEQIKRDEPDVFVRRLKVEMAYHSHHMKEFGEEYEVLLRPRVQSRQPTIPFFSSVTAEVIAGKAQLGSAYWRANLESPVLFRSAIELCLAVQTQDQVFLEIGPHSALAGPIRQILKANGRANVTYVNALSRANDCTKSVLKMAGELHLQNINLDFAKIVGKGKVLTDLPRYQWHHSQVYWSESRVSKEWRLRKFPLHELLGVRTLEGSDLQPEWRNVLRLEDVPWIRDHRVIEDVVFPCAGYVAMAGEAIRQIAGAEDFTMRHITIQTALVLQEFKSIELVTSLQPVRLTTTLDSVWYDFSVASYNGSTWMKHCFGQIRAGKEFAASAPKFEKCPRRVADPYKAMKRIGLNYGPAFQGLKETSALPGKSTATAMLSPMQESESFYYLHPTTIDHCLQLITAAHSEGLGRRLNKLCVPTSLEQLYIRGGRSPSNMKAEAVANSSSFALAGGVIAVSGEDIVLSMIGGKFSPLDDGIMSDSQDTVYGARLEWKPDIQLVPMESLIRPRPCNKEGYHLLEEYTLLSIIEIYQKIPALPFKAKHLQKFGSWLGLQIERAAAGEYSFVSDSKNLLRLSATERMSRLAVLRQSLVEMKETVAFSVLVSRVLDHCQDLFEEKIDGIGLLLPGDGLTKLYDAIQIKSDCADFFALLGHSKPTLRVLEIGAGTGGTTAVVLEALKSAYGERLYSSYTYSDISSGFFLTAKERFKDYRNIEFKVLDISKNPIEQGFEAASFDLIIAANVLHATPSLRTTLTHVHKLLDPLGRLYLQEISPVTRFINLIMGILPGWWLGDAEGRSNEPYLNPKQWDTELRNAGFGGTEAVIYDAEEPYQINANIISRPLISAKATRPITLLHRPEDISPYVKDMEQVLRSQGFVVNRCTLDQTPAPGQHIISLLEIDAPLVEKFTGTTLKAFQRFVANLKSNFVLWVTRSAQMGSSDPRYSMVLGLLRTLRVELSIPLASLEVDVVDASAYVSITQVFKKLESCDFAADMNPDFEYVLNKGVVHVSRYHAISVRDEIASFETANNLPVELKIGRIGLLQSLHWARFKLKELGSKEVVIEPRCIGMNFRDILGSMGLIEGNNVGWGVEGSGVVIAVGLEVTKLKVGDRVMTMASNFYCSERTMSQDSCVKIPSSLSFEAAATMPCVYATVIHCLLKVGGLQRDQTVLIHSACGGVGLAAIQICQNLIGAKIYVTVGSEEKRQFLIENFGLSRDCMFNSRDASFLTGIKRATNGRGVDLVLNSLSGELLHASWKCVAEYGKMIEIGKRDFIGRAKLDMNLFGGNRAFFGVDLSSFPDSMLQPLLTQILELYEADKIKPITPMTVFQASKVEEAFRFMQKGQHIGKLVISIDQKNDPLPITATVQELRLRHDKSYLLIGGLGGLGRAISIWLAEHGATHLVYLSRSAGKSDEDREFFHELECQGCSSQVITGSVTKLENVQEALNSASKPIAGVIQLSMVLRDGPFQDMTMEDWGAAVAPKVEGTWNLHNTLPKDLDFFILTSSLGGIFGHVHQANYAAANAFLDAFVQYRYSQGLSASVLDIGAVADIGYVSRHQIIEASLRDRGVYLLHEQDILDSLHWAILHSHQIPQQGAGFESSGQLAFGISMEAILADPSSRNPWKHESRLAMYHNTDVTASNKSSNSSDQVKLFLSSIEVNPELLDDKSSLDLLTCEIGVTIYTFMLQPIEDLDVTQPLTTLGVDSLVTIEIRNWMRKNLAVDFSTLEIQNARTIEGLGALTIQGLKAKFEDRRTVENHMAMKAP